MSVCKLGLLVVLGVVLGGCGPSPTGGTGDAGTPGGGDGGAGGGANTLLIKAMSFSPTNLVVASPSTITVENMDSFPHTATSEAAAKAYTKGQAPGGFTFDTGDISANGTTTITVPAGLASGTVQPYFCNVHKSGMTDPDPTITIQ